LGSILLSFSGILLIAKPSFIFHNQDTTVSPFGVFMAVNFSFSNSFSIILLRVMKKAKITNIIFLHYVFVPGAIFGALGILYYSAEPF
jgi:hypothetical protein